MIKLATNIRFKSCRNFNRSIGKSDREPTLGNRGKQRGHAGVAVKIIKIECRWK